MWSKNSMKSIKIFLKCLVYGFNQSCLTLIQKLLLADILFTFIIVQVIYTILIIIIGFVIKKKWLEIKDIMILINIYIIIPFLSCIIIQFIRYSYKNWLSLPNRFLIRIGFEIHKKFYFMSFYFYHIIFNR
jgi:hypothetical protein